MYHVYKNQAAGAYLSLYFSIFLSLQFSIKTFDHFFLMNCVVYKLKLGTHGDSGLMYHVYWNQAVASYSSLYFFIFLFLHDISCIPESGCCCCCLFSLFFFLSSFQAFFLGIVRPRRLKLHMNVNCGWCIVYTEIWLLLLILHFISLFFFLSNFQNFKNFDAHFSGSVRPRKLKLGTHVDNGWMYCVYWKQAAAYLIPLFLSFSFSPIFYKKNCCTFLRNCEA